MSKAQRTIINGWVNLNKPLNMSSARAVAIAKRVTNAAKVGHAGTLDPLATGILPLAFGKATKQVNMLMDAKKTYRFDVTFGERRATDDAEGEVIATSDKIPNTDEIKAILSRFTGTIEQLPPIFSALKIDGKRAYDLARAGEEVELKPRQVIVYELKFLGFNENLSSLRTQGSPSNAEKEIPASAGMTKTGSFCATVSKGTYIRSLGRDIAHALNSEGYISALHRSAVGPFTDRDAISLDFLEESVHKAPGSGEQPWLLPLLDGVPAEAATKPDAA